MTSIQETVDKLIASGRTKQDVLSELHNAVDMLRCMPDPGFEAPSGIMKASAKWDVSHIDKLGKHRSRIEAEGDKPMLNVVEIPNEGQITARAHRFVFRNIYIICARVNSYLCENLCRRFSRTKIYLT